MLQKGTKASYFEGLDENGNTVKQTHGSNPVRTICLQYYDAPCGRLRIGAIEGKLCLCDWDDGWHWKATENRLKRVLKAGFVGETTEVIEIARRQLVEYFRRERQTFDLPLLFVGTDFQKLVWAELLRIPYGATISYSVMARNIGMPKAVRAVANANGANPISIIAPCHRVIGSDGSLTGYGGGLETKRFLLELESLH